MGIMDVDCNETFKILECYYYFEFENVVFNYTRRMVPSDTSCLL